MPTVNEAINVAKDLANRGVGIDKDGVYGTQCVDLPAYLVKKFWGKDLWGNAIDLLNSAKSLGFKVEYDAPGVNPKAGAIFVMKTYAHPYGHTGIVIEDSDGYTLKTVEQNVDGNLDALSVGGPARYRNRKFSSGEGKIVGWFYPPYDNVSSAPSKPAVAPISGPKKLKDESAKMIVTVDKLNVRAEPSTSSEVVASYSRNESFFYDSVYVNDGYIWVSYIGGSGKRRYVAAGVANGTVNVRPYGKFL